MLYVNCGYKLLIKRNEEWKLFSKMNNYNLSVKYFWLYIVFFDVCWYLYR